MIEEIRPDVKKLVCDSNIYMIFEENGDITLVDVSDNHHGNWVRQELEKVIDFSKVTTVLLTHLHYDHVGNLDFFPDAKVYASAEDLQDYRKNPGNFFLYDLSEKTKGMLNHAISYSEEIMGMKVIKTPGHTPGSIALLDEKRKLLFSGDTLFADGIGRTDFKNSIPEKMDESVRKLKKFVHQGYTLCPGHDY
jgi:hydroxyacylglutathione hydrolase